MCFVFHYRVSKTEPLKIKTIRRSRKPLAMVLCCLLYGCKKGYIFGEVTIFLGEFVRRGLRFDSNHTKSREFASERSEAAFFGGPLLLLLPLHFLTAPLPLVIHIRLSKLTMFANETHTYILDF